MRTVAFPGLGLEFHLSQAAFTIFGIPVYWYGVIIAAGFLLAVIYCSRKAPKLGIKPDHLIDVLFFAVPMAIVGARLYYVVFYLDLYRNPDGNLNFLKMLSIRDGGLAIYGGVIGGLLTLMVFCRLKKINFFAFADLAAFGLLIGQCIGRWGNFVNVEAYGGPTTLPWRMGIDAYVDGVWQYMEVHPTFLYESLWNLTGFILLVVISNKFRKFDGQLALTYFVWYGFGRGIIEGLRTDSLYFMQTTVRVSQLLGFASAVIAGFFLCYQLFGRHNRPEDLYANRVKVHEESKRRRRAEKLAEEEVGEAYDLSMLEELETSFGGDLPPESGDGEETPPVKDNITRLHWEDDDHDGGA